MAGKDSKEDTAAELKELRRKRAELAAQNDRAERELQALMAKEAAEQEGQRLERIVEAERRRLEAEQKRAKELSDQLGRGAPGKQQKNGKEDEEDARIVELGQTQKSSKVANDPFYGFVVVKRFYGVGEFAKAAKKEAGVVGKTKKLVGM